MNKKPAAKPAKMRVWMFWSAGAHEWTFTQSPELAKHAEKQGWSVIEFKEVRKC